MVRKGDIKLVDEIARRVGLSDDQRELLHEEFRRYYLEDLTYREILELARQIKQDFPNK
jgi:hypothetical protein